MLINLMDYENHVVCVCVCVTFKNKSFIAPSNTPTFLC